MGKTKNPGGDKIEKAMADALASVERIERESGGDDELDVDVEVGDGGDDEEIIDNAETETETDGAPTRDLNEQLLRLAADFENFRKRSRREQEELRKFGVEQVMKAMLPVLDNLDRALQHAAKDDPLGQGVSMVVKQMADAMGTFGITSFDSIGSAFDPERHEAMGQQPAGDADPGSVLEELEKGYLLHDRLLRPAKVIVAAAAQDDAE